MPRRPQDGPIADQIATSLGARLRHLRTEAGWTQAALSARVGLSAEAYARIERGRSLPSFPTLLRLGNLLHVQADVLLDEAQRLVRASMGDAAVPPRRVPAGRRRPVRV
jgi:transcriptional regulator with XRE-family HTH domain